jgi:hypothetical protein
MALWFHATRDARRGVPEAPEGGTVQWNSVPTWVVETTNAIKHARVTVLGLLISNRAELREYDALIQRRAVELALRAAPAPQEREEAVERARRITRNLTSIERQLPRVAAHLTNSIRETTNWAELFFDAADYRLAYYWRVLRRKHATPARLGTVPPTVPRPEWIARFSLEDLMALRDDPQPEHENGDQEDTRP